MTLIDPELLAYATPAERAELQQLTEQVELLDLLESDWRVWLAELFPTYCTAPFAPFHEELWDWIWAIQRGVRPPPLVEVVFRGGAKSTTAELGCVALAARRARRYGLYICQSQDQADDHVANVGALLESVKVDEWYPQIADRALGKYGNVKGWRVNRLRAASGFTIDAVGLDTAARGVKLEEQRPDFLILDDLDHEHDSPKATAKKIKTLTRALLPAGSNDLAVLAVQNLVHEDSIFARLADGRADFLADRRMVGPVPAVADPQWTKVGTRTVLTGGTATWEGMPLSRCQEVIDDIGLTAWLGEAQHETTAPPGGMFSEFDFDPIQVASADDVVFRTITVWVDPAVTHTDDSDACGIQCDGLGDDDDLIYRLFSWEQRATPFEALVKALEVAYEWGADTVGVETDQGGDTWESVYREACTHYEATRPGPHVPAPKFVSAKAGNYALSKEGRASKMLAAYELGWFRHTPAAGVLERALFRFPKTKPFDLTDAAVWSAAHLKPGMFRLGKRSRRRGAPVATGVAA